MRIGILCPSEIAFRRFMPALKKTGIEYAGTAYASVCEWSGGNTQTEAAAAIENERKKAENFKEIYGGKIFKGYENLLTCGEIDAVYIPLPPALHCKWAEAALENGLHVLVEKPAATSLNDTRKLTRLAKEKRLALHENYMFVFHSQIETINRVIKSGEIGEIRLITIAFGFPDRGKNDFRYIKQMGGGALLDCGGYTLKYADLLLGGNAELTAANVLFTDKYDVEIAGSATLKNSKGEVAQVSFGMDNDYRCSVDVWGSKGSLRSNRILTAPDGFVPSYEISRNGTITRFEMQADDAFCKSIGHFYECVRNDEKREENYKILLKQAGFIDNFIRLSGLSAGAGNV